MVEDSAGFSPRITAPDGRDEGEAGAVTEGSNGAGYRIRTRGPLITNQVLYQLS